MLIGCIQRVSRQKRKAKIGKTKRIEKKTQANVFREFTLSSLISQDFIQSQERDDQLTSPSISK